MAQARPPAATLTSAEVRALAALVADGSAGVARISGEVHAAVAGRVFGGLAAGGIGVPGLRRVHDVIARASYAGSGRIATALVRGTGSALGATRPAGALPFATRGRGIVAQGVIGGLWGDRLREAGSTLAPRFGLLVDDRRAVGGRVVVFVHGLGETEGAWRTPGYGDVLAERHGLTPVYARYNSGVAIADSGAELAAGLESLVRGWPVPVTELSLVGHSMGGLVIRAACHRGRSTSWLGRVRVTVALGSPHDGAPLARAAAAAERALGALPETRPFAAPLRARSAGIRDLEHGLSLPFAAGVDHRFVSASVTRDPRAPAGRVLGDLLVHRHSAWAQGDPAGPVRFGDDHYRHLGGATHFGLLGDPAVAELLCEWIGGPAGRLSAGTVAQRP